MEQLLPYLIIIGKSIAIYAFIILAIRVFGKKELAQLSIIDLAFILLISNSVQNAMLGTDTTLLGGVAAASGLFICNYVLKFFMRNSTKFSAIIQGEKVMLIHQGVVIDAGMKATMMSVAELEQAVREHGVPSIDKVNLAVFEVDGNISILSNDFVHRTTHRHKKNEISKNP